GSPEGAAVAGPVTVLVQGSGARGVLGARPGRHGRPWYLVDRALRMEGTGDNRNRGAGQRCAGGRNVAHGGPAAGGWRLGADHQHGPPRKGGGGPPHPWHFSDHERPVSCRPHAAHAFESPWVDLLRAEADG